MPTHSEQTGLEFRKPDSQGRIVIGKEHSKDTYSVEPQKNGDILLRPVVVIPKQEAWLFSNQAAFASVKRGLEQSAKGDLHDKGSFARFATMDDEEE